MNARIATKLRRAAEAETVGFPGRRRLLQDNVMVVNDPLSTRGFYRRLKKEYKNARSI